MNQKRLWLWVAALLLVTSLAGCVALAVGRRGPAPLSPAPAGGQTPAGDRLYVVNANQGSQAELLVVDAGRGAVERKLPLGYLAPGGRRLYTVEHGQGQTTVTAVGVASGERLGQTTLDGVWDVPVAAESQEPGAFSGDGRWLTLVGQPTGLETAAWERTGHPRSRYLVLDTSLNGAGRRVDLAGNFWFDALDGAGATLYLLEVLDADWPPVYSPDRAPRYQVRAYDLARRELDPQPVVDKREVEEMSGFRQAGITSPDGRWLYSIYTRAGKGPFVHALNLASRAAACIDLPFDGSEDFESDMLWSVALSRDGRLLYAVNGATGQAAAVDTSSLAVIRSGTLPVSAARNTDLLARLGRWLVPTAHAKRVIFGSAQLSPDGAMLYAVAEHGLLAVTTGDLALRARYLPAETVTSVALSPDGARLYAVGGGGPGPASLLRIDPQTGVALSKVEAVRGPLALLRVETLE